MPTFGTCAHHDKTWYLLWWSLQMEDQAASSFTSSIITFSPFLSRKWCASFSSQGTHETIRTARAVATEAGKVTILAGRIGQNLDHDTSESCYDIMTCYWTNMQAILKSRNSSGSLWIPTPPPTWPLIIFFQKNIKQSKKSSTFSPGREEVVPTFALPWSTDPPGFPTSIESTELQVLRDSQAKWLPIWSTMLRCCRFLCELLMRGPYLPCVVPWIWRELEVLPCSHWFSATGGFIISRVNMQDD